MDVRWIKPEGVEVHAVADVPALLKREDGFLWIDIPRCENDDATRLAELFRFHPLSLRECQDRVPLPKIHAYRDHFFVVLHGIEAGDAAALHTVELDVFLSVRYLVTVHGPTDDGVPAERTLRETATVVARMESGRFRPKLPAELAHAMVTAIARRLEAQLTTIACNINALERRVMTGDTPRGDTVLEELFRVRHQLLTVRTIAMQSQEVTARLAVMTRASVPEMAFWVEDLLDYFQRLRNISDGQKELLQEVLDFYQTRIANELSHFVKRLTSIGAILVADTLIAGIYGMNFKDMPEIHWKYGYPMALGMMVVVSAVLVVFFRKRDWL